MQDANVTYADRGIKGTFEDRGVRVVTDTHQDLEAKVQAHKDRFDREITEVMHALEKMTDMVKKERLTHIITQASKNLTRLDDLVIQGDEVGVQRELELFNDHWTAVTDMTNIPLVLG